MIPFRKREKKVKVMYADFGWGSDYTVTLTQERKDLTDSRVIVLTPEELDRELIRAWLAATEATYTDESGFKVQEYTFDEWKKRDNE